MVDLGSEAIGCGDTCSSATTAGKAVARAFLTVSREKGKLVS